MCRDITYDGILFLTRTVGMTAKLSCVFAMIVSPTVVYYYLINRHYSSSSSSSKLLITVSVLFINSRRARTSSSYIRLAVRRSATTVDRCCMVCCIKASGVKVSQHVIHVKFLKPHDSKSAANQCSATFTHPARGGTSLPTGLSSGWPPGAEIQNSASYKFCPQTRRICIKFHRPRPSSHRSQSLKGCL